MRLFCRTWRAKRGGWAGAGAWWEPGKEGDVMGWQPGQINWPMLLGLSCPIKKQVSEASHEAWSKDPLSLALSDGFHSFQSIVLALHG